MQKNDCCDSSYQIESVISVDERGQMVLPKELRDKAKIKPGDKFAVISWVKNGDICCMSLVKTENFKGMIADLLGPMAKEITVVK